MKKFLQTTQIALLISTVVFAQKSGPGKQEAPSQTSVIVMGAHSNSIILLSPADGKLIGTGDASKPVLFRWTAVSPKPKETVTYRLKVWQLMQGQSGAEAMRNNQPITTKDVVNITQAAISNLYTGPCKPPYLCDFVWAVEVLNSDGVSVGNSNAGSNAYSFRFEAENMNTVKAEARNKGNAGNTGMPTGKSLNANGDPVNGVDVKLGVKSASKGYKEFDKGLYLAGKNVCCVNPCCSENAVLIDGKDEKTGAKSSKEAQPGTYAVYLPVEKIICDADGNILVMAVKTKTKEINVVIDEVRIIELSKEKIKSLKISNEDYLKALYKYISTGEANSQIEWPIECWQVPCNGSCNTGPSCPGKVWRCKWVGFAK